MQSRYYNAEWGRFINADGIAGSIGELLGHNIFAYCKNNPVNMHDDSGFRAMRCDVDCGTGNSAQTTFKIPLPSKSDVISGVGDTIIGEG